MAKQVLQLGMGDAFDDWLMEKIQLLRRGSVVASGIKRLEQVIILLFNKFHTCCFIADISFPCYSIRYFGLMEYS